MSQLDKPVFTVFAGPNGAGKSTITNLYRDKIGSVIDADQIAREKGISNFEAGRIALKATDKLLSERKNFSIETTLGGTSVIRQMKKAKELGYEVNMHYVGLRSADLHVARVKQRVKEGGHDIPVDDIRRRFVTSIKNLEQAIRHSERTIIWDNTVAPKAYIQIEKDKAYSRDSVPEWFAERYEKVLQPYERIPPYKEINRDLNQLYDRFSNAKKDVANKERSLEKIKEYEQLEYKIVQEKKVRLQENPKDPHIAELNREQARIQGMLIQLGTSAVLVATIEDLKQEMAQMQTNINKMCDHLKDHPDRKTLEPERSR